MDAKDVIVMQLDKQLLFVYVKHDRGLFPSVL